jgi:hypothetical protein
MSERLNITLLCVTSAALLADLVFVVYLMMGCRL